MPKGSFNDTELQRAVNTRRGNKKGKENDRDSINQRSDRGKIFADQKMSILSSFDSEISRDRYSDA